MNSNVTDAQDFQKKNVTLQSSLSESGIPNLLWTITRMFHQLNGCFWHYSFECVISKANPFMYYTHTHTHTHTHIYLVI